MAPVFFPNFMCDSDVTDKRSPLSDTIYGGEYFFFSRIYDRFIFVIEIILFIILS